ncbi:hypothetical protein BSZ32_17010 [Rubritalea profundi]|uniref:Uncharacterized protein n=1 Tax=Rubritalea profundi TaxID=1658618 RepID=A0A2S7U614_9BACT|nr:hypothetical protein BSZ32_17010 [Rubritalea profundi]
MHQRSGGLAIPNNQQNIHAHKLTTYFPNPRKFLPPDIAELVTTKKLETADMVKCFYREKHEKR